MWPSMVDAKDVINGSVMIPRSPGVYAWYRRLSVDETSEASFLDSIVRILHGTTWPTIPDGKGTVGPYQAEIQLRPSIHALSSRKTAVAEMIATQDRSRAIFARLVLHCSVLQPPLYVGRSQILRDRIDTHLHDRSQFTSFLDETFDPSQLVLAYMETRDVSPAAHELLEAVVGAAALPRYAQRIG